MVKQNHLKRFERQAYRLLHKDGLLDIAVAFVIGGFAIIPLLNDLIHNDLISGFLLLPFFLIASLVYRYGKKHITQPRIGIIRHSRAKISRKFFLLLGLNVALGLGIIIGVLVFQNASLMDGLYIAIFSLLVLFVASLAAWALDLPRLSFYGIFLAAAGPLGEMLRKRFAVPHHGIPVTYGASAMIIMLVGIFLLVQFIRQYNIPQEGFDVREK